MYSVLLRLMAEGLPGFGFVESLRGESAQHPWHFAQYDPTQTTARVRTVITKDGHLSAEITHRHRYPPFLSKCKCGEQPLSGVCLRNGECSETGDGYIQGTENFPWFTRIRCSGETKRNWQGGRDPGNMSHAKVSRAMGASEMDKGNERCLYYCSPSPIRLITIGRVVQKVCKSVGCWSCTAGI